VSIVQLPAHAFAPQVYGSHETSCSAGHEPALSHDAAMTATPELHDGARQVVLLPG
jgi:hypothetical protein